jgi:hypothetical protein
VTHQQQRRHAYQHAQNIGELAIERVKTGPFKGRCYLITPDGRLGARVRVDPQREAHPVPQAETSLYSYFTSDPDKLEI